MVVLILLDTLEVAMPREDSMELRTLQGANSNNPTNRTVPQNWVFGFELWITCIFQIKEEIAKKAVTKVTEVMGEVQKGLRIQEILLAFI